MLETDRDSKGSLVGLSLKLEYIVLTIVIKMIINIVRKTKSISFTVAGSAGSHLSIRDRVHKSLQKIYKHSLSYKPL